jgi:hypothetical protein
MWRAERGAVLAGVSLLAACATNPAPSGWLPRPGEAPSDVYGAWVEIGPSGSRQSIAGELLAIDHDSVYVLRSNGRVVTVSVKDAAPATIAFYEAELGNVAGLTMLGSLTTVSNGYYLVLTFPTWVVIGTVGAAADSRAPLIHVSPGDNWLPNRMFARFPAGMPPNLPREGLRLGKKLAPP